MLGPADAGIEHRVVLVQEAAGHDRRVGLELEPLGGLPHPFLRRRPRMPVEQDDAAGPARHGVPERAPVVERLDAPAERHHVGGEDGAGRAPDLAQVGVGAAEDDDREGGLADRPAPDPPLDGAAEQRELGALVERLGPDPRQRPLEHGPRRGDRAGVLRVGCDSAKRRASASDRARAARARWAAAPRRTAPPYPSRGRTRRRDPSRPPAPVRWTDGTRRGARCTTTRD